MQRIFNLDPQLLADAAFLAINIFILFLVASYLLFNPVRDMLKKRQDGIKNELEAADESRAVADKLKLEYEDKLKNADKEVDQILSEARKKGNLREEQIVEEAKKEAARIIERANNEIELDKKRAIDDMKKEMIAVATMMAGKVVSKDIDTQMQESLVEETLNEMGDKTWLS